EMLGVRTEMARRYGTANRLNEVVVDPADAWLGIVAPGHLYPRLREALRLLGLTDHELASLGIRILRVGLLHPLDRGDVRSFARGLHTLLVVEEKRPFLELHLRNALYGMANAPLVVGELDANDRPLVPNTNTLDTDSLLEPLRRCLTQRIDAAKLRPASNGKARINIPLVARTPFFCSGCPHNSSTAAPTGTLVGAGIGCHCMVVYMEEEHVGHMASVTCMGSEGAQWVGMAPFVSTAHFVQNLGDGTFAHSGQLAIQAAVAAGVNITYKLLYNGVVAMTGGQGAVGAMAVPSLAEGFLAQGVSKVVITTEDRKRYKGVDLPRGVEVRDRSRLIETQEELAKIAGVTVLIHDQRCAAETRRDRKRGLVATPAERIVINERVCEGCGDCGSKSNCLSVQPVETEFGRKTQIHQGSCNFDRSCLNGDCPSFATVSTKGGHVPSQRSAPTLAADDLPPAAVASAPVTVRMPGIGGTGVVTVSQVLGMAASLEGLTVAGLDQTGLSQKAGPVVSDLSLSAGPAQSDNKIAKGHVDLCLAFDLLVAVQPAQLDGLSATRTVVVGSTSESPTGQAIRHPDQPTSSIESLRAILDDHSQADRNAYLDAIDLCERLFDDDAMANIMLLGVAHQLGLLPVSTAALEQAIEMNGVAVDRNLQAFRWGRLWVADRARFEKSLPRSTAPEAPSPWALQQLDGLSLEPELRTRIARRVDDLVGFQSRRYARRYIDVIARVVQAEQQANAGSTVLTEAVAFNLHHLMAYKDEYEVARLLLSDEARQQLEAVGGPRIKVVWHLHPPLLRSLGVKKKVRLGPWFRPALSSLSKLKAVRGRAIDPFAHNEVRRTERALVDEYPQLIDSLLASLDETTVDRAAEIANLADRVRGYEHLKLKNVAAYRSAVSEAMAAL
ncbi:MAG: 2-oxoacid ferredoxin oxidoreductase, partial [Acidimicrobiia bacterium]|nr:2-oxoacid ferredoxin oxidoreductase [Acidimicrobiia bacterium]